MTEVTGQQVASLIDLMRQQLNVASGEKRKTQRPDRPVINAGIDDREWSLFKDTWSRYKQMIGVSSETLGDVETIRMELRASCSPDVNRMLFEFVGPTILNSCTEDQLLDHIKSVAVKITHPEVHQMNFHAMRQEPGESITHYVARLKSQAFLCKFEVTCGCTPATTISYSDNMVSQRLVAGLRSVDHQRRVLSEAATLTTLDLKVKRLQLLETTEQSATVLHQRPGENSKPTPQTSEACAARSQYKEEQIASKMGTQGGQKTDESPAKCRGCGQAPHPGGRSKCPASKKACNNCGIKGHFVAVCERRSRSNPITTDGQPRETPSNGLEPLDSISSGAAVSFAFGAQQDFRPVRRNGVNR